jgi:hypothetical protein
MHFQGDNITISLLSQVLQTDIILLDTDYNITDLSNQTHQNENLIILSYIKGRNNSGHYKTIGLSHGKNVQTIFVRQNLPDEVKPLLDKELFYQRHISNHIRQNLGNVTLDKVIEYLENTLMKKREIVIWY